MKRTLLLIIFTGLFTDYIAQNPNWETINTGHILQYGQARFIVKQNAIYSYNANYSTLIRSKSRGVTWDSIAVPSDSSQHLYSDIVFVNDSLGYLAGYDGGVFSGYGVRSVIKKTVNYGSTWQTVNNGIKDSCLFSHINFFDADNGIVFGTGKGRTQRFETHDGGASWSYVNDVLPYEIDLQSTQNSEFFTNDAVAIGSTNHFKVAFSNDGGNSWVTKTHHNSQLPTALDFFDKDKGVFAAHDSVFFTTDGANSFSSKRPFVSTQVIRDLAMIDMQRGFYCAPTSIYYTGDGGLSWQLSYSDPSSQLGSVEISGPDIFASTIGSKNILKLNISSLVGLSEEPAPDGGFKVYPNPVTDKMNIQLPPGREAGMITILDGLGRTIRELDGSEFQNVVAEDLVPGLYTVRVVMPENVYYQKILVSR